MTRKELQKGEVLMQVKNKALTCREAAIKLGIGIRQVFRCLGRYKKDGSIGLIHRSRGKKSNHQINATVTGKTLELLRNKYLEFGPTLASENLAKRDGIMISREFLRQLMIKNGLWQKKRKRKAGKKWRLRRECVGELVQVDGSEHRWFFGIDQLITLIGFIDDATSRIMHAKFCSGESTKNLMISTKEYCLEHGKPCELYSDRGSVYKVNTGNLNDDLCTQYEHGLSLLDINLIHAYSPQAKGRIERLFGTLQDRLVKELKLANIASIDEANAYLKNVFIPEHNKRFAVSPSNDKNMHRPATETELDAALCILSERKVSNDWTVRYENKILQLDHTKPSIVKPKDCVIIHQKLSGELYVTIRKEVIKSKDITNKKRVKAQSPARNYTPRKPAQDHPWRRLFLTPKKSVYVSHV